MIPNLSIIISPEVLCAHEHYRGQVASIILIIAILEVATADLLHCL